MLLHLHHLDGLLLALQQPAPQPLHRLRVPLQVQVVHRPAVVTGLGPAAVIGTAVAVQGQGTRQHLGHHRVVDEEGPDARELLQATLKE